MMRILFRIMTLLLMVLALVGPADGRVGEPAKRVLVLNSYHETYSWSDRVMNGVKSVFAGEDVELFISYMDTKHISSEEYFSQLRQLYALKFRLVKFDAIVSSDDNALNFLLDHRNDLFPGVPVFFCGINDFSPEILEGRRRFTGITESYDVQGTVEMMLQLHPATKQIVTITDETISGQAFLNRIERAEPAFANKIKFTNLHNTEPEALCEILESLPPDALVLWAIYIRTPDGRALSSSASIRLITDAAKVPVYCVWDVVGFGVVGGKITSPEFQGTAAAGLALRYLRGEDVTDLPVEGSPLDYVFDYQVLKTFGITETALPAGSVIRNRPYSIYDDHKMVIWSVLAVVILELTIILSLIHYIMQRRQAESKLASAREQLAQGRKLEAIGQLAGGVAHDFNNVLASIGGAAEVLEVSAREKDRKYIEMILELTDRASRLTAKLLAFGRKGNVLLEPTDLHRTIANTVDILKVSLRKNITIKTELKAAYSIVMADEPQITNILLNLGINAEHAMESGGEFSVATSIVSLDRRACSESGFKLRPGRFFCMDVGDSGTGIAEENLDKVFEPFFTTRELGKGTGLGLASVYGSIIEHKGAITVESQVGEGTQFRILLPITEQLELPVGIDLNHHRGSGQLILLADDEQLVRNTSSKMLTDLNYHVVLATNGEEAVDIYKKRGNEIDLIILDVVMPKISGRKAYEQISAIDEKVKVIFTSGFTGGEAVGELAAGVNTAFLRKPYRTQDLHRLIAAMLSAEVDAGIRE
jgi:signal transduction histidine kinase/CheY-like chemotaxis protein